MALEDIVRNGAFAMDEQMFIFYNVFKDMQTIGVYISPRISYLLLYVLSLWTSLKMCLSAFTTFLDSFTTIIHIRVNRIF